MAKFNPDKYLQGAHALAGEQLKQKLDDVQQIAAAVRKVEKDGQDHETEMSTAKLKYSIRKWTVIGVLSAFVVLSLCGFLHLLGAVHFEYIQLMKVWWGHLLAAISSGSVIAHLDGKPLALGTVKADE